MSATTYFEGLVLGHALRQQPFSISEWYVGLWTDDPTAAGLLTDEVTAGDYTRKLVSWGAGNTNDTPIVWAQATSDWGVISFVCLLNSPVKGTGNMLIFQDREDVLDINPGVSVTIPVNGLTASVT